MKMMKRVIFVELFIGLSLVLGGCDDNEIAFQSIDKPISTVMGNGKRTLLDTTVQYAEITPFAQFGPIWGDRDARAHGTSGIFPPDGRSPLHIHTAGYHGVVLFGTLTNPFGTENSPELLTPGSHWYVPAREEHVTACEPGQECRFYFHSENRFDFTPIAGGIATQPRTAEADTDLFDSLIFDVISPFASFSTVWGDRDLGAHGTIGRFNPNSESPMHTHSETYYGVVIQGQMTNPFDAEDNPVTLNPGDYWYVPEGAVHTTACISNEECLFYFHSNGAFDFLIMP